jgi:hypothetical protein
MGEINIVKLAKHFSHKKFNIFKSELFPVIHEVNIKMKNIFEMIRNYINQFEDLRRRISPTSPDSIRNARFSINETYSVFFDIMEIVNKLETVNISEMLRLADKLMNKSSLLIDNRLNHISVELDKSRKQRSIL